MPTITQFPDVIAVTATYLRAELIARSRPVPVVSRVPSVRPAEFVRLRRLGGPRRDIVTDLAQVAVECWSGSPVTADSLAQLCRGLLWEMGPGTHSGAVIFRVRELGGPADLPDPTSNQDRSTFSVQIALRGVAA